jgi:hypothetical protein
MDSGVTRVKPAYRAAHRSGTFSIEPGSHDVTRIWEQHIEEEKMILKVGPNGGVWTCLRLITSSLPVSFFFCKDV